MSRILAVALSPSTRELNCPINETKQDVPRSLTEAAKNALGDLEEERQVAPKGILRQSKWTRRRKQLVQSVVSMNVRNCYLCAIYGWVRYLLSPFNYICRHDTIHQWLHLLRSWKTTVPFIMFSISCCLIQYSRVVAILFLMISLGYDSCLDNLGSTVENESCVTMQVCSNCGCCQAVSTRRVRFGNDTRFTKSRKPRRITRRRVSSVTNSPVAGVPSPPPPPPFHPSRRLRNGYNEQTQDSMECTTTNNENEDILTSTRVLLEDLTSLSDRWKKILEKKKRRQSRQQKAALKSSPSQAEADLEPENMTPVKKGERISECTSNLVSGSKNGVDTDDEKFAEALVTNLDRLRDALVDIEQQDDNNTAASIDERNDKESAATHSSRSSPSSSSPHAAVTRARLERLKLVVEQLQPKQRSPKGANEFKNSCDTRHHSPETSSKNEFGGAIQDENGDRGENLLNISSASMGSPSVDSPVPCHRVTQPLQLELSTPRGECHAFWDGEYETSITGESVIGNSPYVQYIGSDPSFETTLLHSPTIVQNGTVGEDGTDENDPDRSILNDSDCHHDDSADAFPGKLSPLQESSHNFILHYTRDAFH